MATTTVTSSPGVLNAGYIDLDLEQQSAEGTGEANGSPKPQLVGRGEEPLPTVRPGAGDDAEVKQARIVSVVSLVASCIAAALSLGIGAREELLSLVGFGVESLLDGVSSALVLWRFKRPKVREHADAEAAIRHKVSRDRRRERNSAIGIGVTFVASSLMLLVFAVAKLLLWDPDAPLHVQEENDGAYYSSLLSWPAAVVFGSLAYGKFRLARELHSQVLEKDAFCSVLGAVLALICAIASLIELVSSDDHANMELVDVTAGSLISLLLGVEGIRTLWHNLPNGTWSRQHQPMA